MRPLTPEQFPYTGPYGSPNSGLKHQGPTVIALRRSMWRLGFMSGAHVDEDDWTADLTNALGRWDPGQSGYGEGRWTRLRSAVIPKGQPHAGERALDDLSIGMVVAEHKQHPPVPLVYPHPAGTPGRVGGIHETGGLPGNYALDFMAPGGTTLLAPFSGTITKTSGRSPAAGVRNGDRFGWSIYLKRADGAWLFMTHEGEKLVRAGQMVAVGQPIGRVGHWPHDEGRSHTHCGATAARGGRAASIALIESIARAPRVAV